VTDVEDFGKVERLLACIELSKTLVSADDMESLLTAALERIKILIPAQNWSILLVEPQTHELTFAVAVGVDAQTVKGIRLKMGEGIAGAVAQSGQPIFIPDVAQDHRFCPRVDEATGFDTRSIIALPLQVRGEVVGVFEVINVENQNYFREQFLPLLNIMSDYLAIAVDNIRNLQQLQARTYIDEVTGFYNTRYLAVQLERLIPEVLTQGRELSVIFFDLDHFKDVVDTHGHLLGTKVLGQVSRVANLCLSPGDSLVRYGGDEYLILLPDRSQAQAVALAQRIRQALRESLFLEGEGLNVRLTASFGVATLPQDARDQETLLKIADRAMFRSKDRGKDRIMVGQDLTPAPEE
jgi:diguanylate cyclase (GGDEF)-like protein